MKIELKDKTEIEILAINFDKNTFDWRRTSDYQGACTSPISSLDKIKTSIKDDLKILLEGELIDNASVE